jgi:phage terminase large subunit-like protein
VARTTRSVDPRLSEEVRWYLRSRGIPHPHCPPRFLTPDGSQLPGAVFDPGRVDRVLRAFSFLRHTQGRLAGRPLALDPWQVAYKIAPVFGWVRPDDHGEIVRVVRSAYFEEPRKNGKLLDMDTAILTDGGWKTMGTIAAGDLVHAPDGSQVRVTFASEVQVEPTYRVRFASGQELVAGARHQWQVKDRYRERWLVLTTEEIAGTYLIGNRPSHRERRYAVAIADPLVRPAVPLPVDPYVLGAWLGDGNAAGARLSGIDEEIHEAFVAAGYPPGKSVDRCTRSYLSLQRPLRELGVLGRKHVPVVYLLGSSEQRLAVLRGLMDTDGSVAAGPNTPRVEFSNTNRQLAEDVLFLARSLGWKASIRPGRSRLGGRDYGERYRVTWTAWAGRSPFTLARKTNALAQAPIRRTRSHTNAIVEVEQVPGRPMRCIEVDHPSHCYLAGPGLVPTHNTTISGGLGLYLTGADDEPGAQVYALAAGKDQARFCFDPVKALVEKSEGLDSFKATASRIVHRPSSSYFAVVSSLADLLHGANIHGAVIDELHIHKTASLVEAVESGTGSRRQPLVITITTADDGRQDTIYARKRERIEQLARGALADPSVYGVIWAADPEAEGYDPFDEATWAAANPGYGISPTREYLRSAAAEAQQSPAQLAVFLRLHLGIRTRQESKYFELAEWDAGQVDLDEAALAGRECFGGLDLASTEDLTALCWDFPDWKGGHETIWRMWVPEAALPAFDRRTAGQASVWVRRGWLTTTPGNTVDQEFIRQQINRDRAAFRVREIAYDPWNASPLVTDLQGDGAVMVPVRQGYASMSPPTKALKRLWLAGLEGPPRDRHAANSCIRWQVDNFAAETDAAGNVKPSKVKAGDKIDGLVARILALDRAMRHADKRAAFLGSA